MAQIVDDDARQDTSVDRFHDFLVAKGKLAPNHAGDRDDRIFNAAMSCIELSLRPYDRRLLARSLHDADRLEALLEDRPGVQVADDGVSIFTPAEFREFVSLVEREVPQPGPEGPVPALFRNGAHLIAASYLWEREDLAPVFHRIAFDLRVSLRLLDDLLGWVESGKRGDRIETLREARSRMDAMEAEQRSHHERVLGELGGIAEAVGALRADLTTGAEADILRDVQGEIAAMRAELRQLAEASAGDDALHAVARDIEARITGLSDVTTQVVQGQQEIVRMLIEIEKDREGPNEEEMESAIDQLRSLMLIGLVGIAVVAILVIVSITTG